MRTLQDLQNEQAQNNALWSNADLSQLSKSVLDSMYNKGYVINPNADLTNPKTLAEFTKIAEGEIDPYFKGMFSLARESFLRDVGYTTEDIQRQESELQRKYGQQVRQLGSQAAESGFALSGQRQLNEQNLAQDTQSIIDQNRRQLG